MKRFISSIFAFFSLSFFSVFAAEHKAKPKVSIVVPVYGVERWLPECMDSLVNQTLKEIEIICVDDGSPDNCGAILDKYAKKDHRVKVIHQKNAGVQKARNAGLDIATGEYIALVDSDDYVELNTYEIAYNYAKKDNVDVLHFGHRVFDDGYDNHENYLDLSDRPVISLREYWKNEFGNYTWDNLFKYDIIQKDKIRFVPGIKPADDTCFTYSAMGRAKRIKSIPARFYNYRIRPCALSRMTPSDIFINSYKMFKHICDSWRQGDCIKGQEDILLTKIINWSGIYHNISLNYAQEILDSFGSDVYNPQIVAKCPEHIQKELKRLEYSAKSNRKPPLESGIYRIATATSGYSKRLDISEASGQIGANLQQWETNCSIAQDFEVVRHDEGYYTIKAVCSGKMLDVNGAGEQSGTNIHQWDSNGTQAQHWYIVPCGDGSFNIISECNLLAMDVSGNNNNNGANVHCWDINNTNAQKFKFIKSDLQDGCLLSNGTYIISSALNENKVLDIRRASKRNGANLQLWDKNYTNAQKFNVEYIGDKLYKITPKCSNKPIDVQGAEQRIGANIWQYENNNTDAQKWYIISCGNGFYKIVSKCNNLVMDVNGAQTKNGTNIQCWGSNGTNAQKFRFIKV